ncbi:MAG: peptide ABC transporter substrate-binding protein [Candidatus Eremiobacteraeota bacterium]|nr:peptide ABC transporter substrate-binding protein [Candidatus Eremiobacteraeota bacterium]
MKKNDHPIGPVRVAWVCLLALALSACSRVGMQTSGGGSQWTVPGVVRVGFYEDLDNLNPTLSLQSFVIPVQNLIFNGLVRYNDRYEVEGDAAQAVPTLANGGISKDGLTITYHLRKGIRFSDGVPLTSADVKFTWQQAMNPRNNTPNRVPSDKVASMDTPDPLTVVVHLKQPYAPFIGTFLQIHGSPNGAILPKHLLDKYQDLNQVPFNSHPVGSGPFTLRTWEPGNQLLFDPNPGYWEGKPKLKEIQIRIIPNQNTLLTALRTHEIDFYYDVPEPQYSQVNAIAGVRISKQSSFSIEHIKFNCRSPLLRDVNVRRAVAYGIDWARLANDVYLGLGTPAMADISPRSWAYNPSVTPYPHNPAKARQILTQAGWRQSSSGVFEKNGVPLKISMMTVVGVSARLKAEQLIQQELKAAGMDVEIHNYPANLVFATNGMLMTGRYDLALVTMDLSPDPDNSINLSPDQLPPVGQNRSFFVDADVGRWEQAAQQTYDLGVRKKYYWLVQQRVHDELPIHGIVWRPTIEAVNAQLRNFKPGSGSDFWNAYQWSI